MPLPSFLILGAMKAGTTSLADALSMHKEVFIPARQEPQTLSSASEISKEQRIEYERMFQPVTLESAVGEASTNYTKRHLGGADAARNAHALCGPGLRLIYLVRDPWKRAQSHYKHRVRAGLPTQPGPITEHDPLCEVGCYSFQLEPWVQRFGKSNILVIEMSSLIRDWDVVGRQVATHLGVDPSGIPKVLPHSNSSAESFQATGVRKRVLESSVYRDLLQDRIPAEARRLLRKQLLTKRASNIASEVIPTSATIRRWQEDLVRLEGDFGVRVALNLSTLP